MTSKTTDYTLRQKVNSLGAGFYFRLTAKALRTERDFTIKELWQQTRPLKWSERNTFTHMNSWPQLYMCAACGKCCKSPVNFWFVVSNCGCDQPLIVRSTGRNRNEHEFLHSKAVDFTYSPINPHLIAENPFYRAGFLLRVRDDLTRGNYTSMRTPDNIDFKGGFE